MASDRQKGCATVFQGVGPLDRYLTKGAGRKMRGENLVMTDMASAAVAVLGLLT